MTTNNLQPIPEGYELVPKEDYDKPKAEGTLYYDTVRWSKATIEGRYVPSFTYIRPIKPVATEAPSCMNCKHSVDSPLGKFAICKKAFPCATDVVPVKFEQWEPANTITMPVTSTPEEAALRGAGMFNASIAKPPLGLMPRSLWQSSCRSSRIAEIRKAMCRYASEKKHIPYEWVEELFDLEENELLGKEQP